MRNQEKAVAVVFGEVGMRDPIFHLTSECPSIPSEGVRPMRWQEARERVMLPRFCEACGPMSVSSIRASR